jgi:hypothetical protein
MPASVSFWAGSHELIRLFGFATGAGYRKLKEMEALAERCMADHDESGWTQAIGTARTCQCSASSEVDPLLDWLGTRCYRHENPCPGA